MKHGSAEKPKRTNSGDKSEAGSMPSSSSELPTSGVGNRYSQKNSANGADAKPAPNTSEQNAGDQAPEKTAVNALLMACINK